MMCEERKLASIRRVSQLLPIENADRIETALIDGWTVVVKKGDFAVDDLVVYCEVDSWIPEPIAPFLTPKGQFTKSFNGVVGNRLKTVRLRKQLSQGLVLPLSVLGENFALFEGLDVTEHLGIQKYEKPIPANMRGQQLGSFPSFIPKTDQPRIQNEWKNIKDRLDDPTCEITLKLDGSSVTVYKYGEHSGICSRNVELKWDTEEAKSNVFVKTVLEHRVFDILTEYGRDIAIQAELMGPGVQSNRENFKDHLLFVFDIFDIENGRYFTPTERIKFMNWVRDRDHNIDGLLHVPIVDVNKKISDYWSTLEDALDMSNNIRSINNPVAEGLVYKFADGYSFKVISNVYLESEE